MIRRDFRYGIVLTLLLVSLLLSGCAKNDRTVQAPPTIGVADWEAVVQAHPLYAAYMQKKQRLESKRWLTWGTFGRIELPTMKNDLDIAPTAAERDAAQSLERADGRMQAKVQEDRLKAAAEQELQQYWVQLESADEAKLLNLKLRETMLSAARDDAQANAQVFSRSAELIAVQQEIGALKQQREQKLAQREREITQRLNHDIQALRLQVSQQGLAKQRTAQAVPPEFADGATADKDADQKEMLELQTLEQEVAALEQQIRRDVEAAAAVVAKRKGLDTIVTKMAVYFNAVDSSEEIIAELAKK